MHWVSPFFSPMLLLLLLHTSTTAALSSARVRVCVCLCMCRHGCCRYVQHFFNRTLSFSISFQPFFLVRISTATFCTFIVILFQKNCFQYQSKDQPQYGIAYGQIPIFFFKWIRWRIEWILVKYAYKYRALVSQFRNIYFVDCTLHSTIL